MTTEHSIFKIQAYLKSQDWTMGDFDRWYRIDLNIKLSKSGQHEVSYTGFNLRLVESFTDNLVSLTTALESLQQGAEEAIDNLKNSVEDCFNFESPDDFHG